MSRAFAATILTLLFSCTTPVTDEDRIDNAMGGDGGLDATNGAVMDGGGREGGQATDGSTHQSDDARAPDDAGHDGGSDAMISQAACLTSASLCDNSKYCDGIETCSPNDPAANADGCISGTAVVCMNGLACDTLQNKCPAQCEVDDDVDNDGAKDPGCGGNDCDDNDGARFPGNADICDGKDNDCAGGIDDGPSRPIWYADQDGDSHGDSTMSTQACAKPNGYVASSDDCDDSKSARYPGNSEICDNVDNDCNTTIDNGAAPSCPDPGPGGTKVCAAGGVCEPSCANGYQRNGTACADVDECPGNPCDSNGDNAAVCSQNSPGSGYACSCSGGFKSSGSSSPVCVAINECAEAPVASCPNPYECTDLTPYYTCRGQFAEWPMPGTRPNSTLVTSSYTNNGGGRVTDNRTKLIWQQGVTSQATWSQANNACAAIGEGWRLPSLIELESIRILGESSAPNIDPIFAAEARWYWTLSECTNGACAGPHYAVAFTGDGGIEARSDNESTFTYRCVKSGEVTVSSSSRYSTTDGTVTDLRTGLVWQRKVPNTYSECGNAADCTFAQAQNYCGNLVLENNSNWRVPTAQELATIIDPSRTYPPVDPTAFPSARQTNYWTSTQVDADSAGGGGTAANLWVRSFGIPRLYAEPPSNRNAVHCVR